MPRIRSLRPNVTREEALRHFSPGGPLDWLRTTALGPLRSLAEVYIPFRLFQVEILNGKNCDRRVLGLEAVTGTLDLYQFEQLPGPEQVVCLETRNCPEARLEEAEANELALAKLRRVLFSRGFFRIRNLRLSAEAVPGDLHIPYWVGFRGHGAGARMVVMDAVRRQVEGAKVRQLLNQWLTAPQ